MNIPLRLLAQVFISWNKPESHETTFYAEYNGYGEGYKPNERASFAHILTADEAAMYTKENVLGKISDKMKKYRTGSDLSDTFILL